MQKQHSLMKAIHTMQHVPCKKRAYKDKAAALAVLHYIQNKHDGKRKPVRVYECDNCRQWHLTSDAIDKDKNTAYQPVLDWSKLIND